VTLVVFSLGDLSYNPYQLRGITFNKTKQQWEKIICPGPDILYDRFVGKNARQIINANLLRHNLRKMGIPSINSQHYFDKWKIHQLLMDQPEIAPHLPETRPLQDLNDLQQMLKEYGTVYVKKTTGRRGKEVISFSRQPGGRYRYSYFDNLLYAGEIHNLSGIEELVNAVLGSKNLIVQQGIDLIRRDDRIVDMRAEMQRNGRAELEIVAILVRLGISHSPVATHGSSMMLDQALSRRFGKKTAKNLTLTIHNFVVKIYNCIEQAYGPFGEIAIDFGYDTKGKLWFFECNSKSARVSLLRCGNPETVDRSFLNPMLYARYLYHKQAGNSANRTLLIPANRPGKLHTPAG
jgi:hypothetical protein